MLTMTAARLAWMCSLLIACGGSPAAEDAPTPDAGSELDQPIVLGEPFEIAPEDLGTWVWVEMPEMVCADGSLGGFAVNMLAGAEELLFFLQGGGICYDQVSCAVGGAPRNVGATPLTTALDARIRDHVGIFDRDDPDNPFRAASYVVVPHCTGDFHLGTKVTMHEGTEELHHVGYLNIRRLLSRLVPTFQTAQRITVAGFSAGGVGITGNYQQIAGAFASVGQPPPALIADGSPLVRPEFLTMEAQSALKEAWGVDAIASNCPRCVDEGFHEMYRANLERVPGLRSSLLCAYEDSVVVTLFTLLNRNSFNAARLRASLVDLADWAATLDVPGSTHRTLYFEGTRHAALNEPLATTPGLVEFLRAQLDASSTWTDVRP